MWETLIAIASGTNVLFDLYRNVSSIKPTENQSDRYLDQITSELSRLNIGVERLSEHILYVPTVQGVKDTTRRYQNQVQDLREVRAYLDPIQQAFSQNIISSGMIATPEKLHQAMKKSPWDVLVNIRPVRYAEPSSDLSMVPVLFQDDGITYCGFQKRGILPIMFNCEYDELWLPHLGRTSTSNQINSSTAERNSTANYQPSSRTIYVGNLSDIVTEDDVKEVFSEYGTVQQVRLSKDSKTGSFAFVEMSQENEARDAVDALDGAEWMGFDLEVMLAQPSERIIKDSRSTAKDNSEWWQQYEIPDDDQEWWQQYEIPNEYR